MIISREYKLIFIHVQKTAGTSASTFLRKHLKAEMNGKKHESASEAKARLPDELWNTCYKVAFVRNPWDRLVSWYHHMRKNYTRPGDNPFWDYLLNTGDSFEAYVIHGDKTIMTPWGPRNLFTNQCHQLSLDGRLLIDYVGKFEQLESDWGHILGHVGYGGGEGLSRDNSIPRSTYQKYYSSETRAIVEGKFREDIEAFGYEF